MITSSVRSSHARGASGLHVAHPEASSGHPSRCSVRFTRREIREFSGWTPTRLHIHLKELVDLEYVLVDSGRNGTVCRYRLAYEGQGKDGSKFMLGLTDPETLT
ncbi:MAG: hypothetical protein HN700_19875 [Verrucomicrobia bacterium]|nr:hypothetical protein [Verrucomicrobiota bacterium]